jgi:cysteinyl-tRNA synthetase
MARYWLHNGFVQVNGHEDVEVARQLLHRARSAGGGPSRRGDPLRAALAHYRQPIDITRDGLKEAKTRWTASTRRLQRASVDAEPQPNDHILAALADDLNTPLAISEMHELVSKLNKAKKPEEKGR